MTNSINKKDYIKRSFYLLGILFIILIWYIGFLSFDNDFIVPSINQTINSLEKLFIDSYTYKVLFATLLRLFISISVCFILGVILACLSKIYYQFKSFIKPIITLLKTLPITVLIVLLLVALSSDSLYYIVGVVVLPIIYEATINGLDSIDNNIVDAVKLESNINVDVVKKIYLPLTLPYIFTSLLQSFGLGLKVLVMAEFISNTKHSIGYEIILYKDFYNDMSFVYAWSIILIFFVLIVDFIISKIKAKSLV